MTSGTIRLRAEERWQGASLSTKRLSRTMAAIALVSLAGHVAILAGAAFDTKRAIAPTQEIAVEIVQDVPKPAEKPPVKAAEMPKPFEIDKGKTETAKLEAKEPAKPEAAKPEQPKPETPKPEAPKPEAKAEQPPTPKAPPPPPKADEDAAKDKQMAALQQQLESLKAEQAQLQAQRDAETAAETAAAQQPAPMRDTGMGPLPDSFQAVALPAAADGQGEATSYQEIVFSALAKAKGIGGTEGLPGTAAVHFSIDATGKLVDVELVHKSGVATLDAEAVDIVHRAAPFPVPPQGAQRVFDANFTFKTQAASR